MSNWKWESHLTLAIQLIEAGVPIFVAKPASNASNGSEFYFPREWDRTEPDIECLKAWRPRWAVCAVTGVKFDVFDVDPRNGSELPMQVLQGNNLMPPIHGEVATPSGGVHYYIPRSHTRKSSEVWPGIDIQAGGDFGNGRGFVYIPPTIRRSKVNGELRRYKQLSSIHPGLCVEDEQSAQQLKWLEVFNRCRKDVEVTATGTALGREMRINDPWAEDLFKQFGLILESLRNFPQNKERSAQKSEWNMLNRQSMAVGGFISGSGLPESVALEGLKKATLGWLQWGWSESSLEYYITRGIEHGKTLPICFDDYDFDPSVLEDAL